jgi:hypothetical protein
MPRLTRELLRGLVEKIGGRVVAEVDDPQSALERVRELAPALVIVGEEAAFAGRSAELARALASSRVLGVTEAGRCGELWEIEPHLTPVGDLGEASLRRALEVAT